MAVLTINGVAVKSPSRMIVSVIPVTSRADRNAAGDTVIDRIARKRKLECEWRYLTTAELQTIQNNAGKDTVFFSVMYFDAEDNANKTITCYVGVFEMGMHRHDGTRAVGWEDVKLELIER